MLNWKTTGFINHAWTFVVTGRYGFELGLNLIYTTGLRGFPLRNQINSTQKFHISLSSQSPAKCICCASPLIPQLLPCITKLIHYCNPQRDNMQTFVAGSWWRNLKDCNTFILADNTLILTDDTCRQKLEVCHLT